MTRPINLGINDAWRAQVTQNSARQAFVYKTYITTGVGDVMFEEPIDFGLVFVEEPNVAYGFALAETDPVQELVDNDYPASYGGVYRWRKTIRGLYVGALVFGKVANLAASYTLVHHFTFSGIGVKDVPSNDEDS